jgi:hypothetical protein
MGWSIATGLSYLVLIYVACGLAAWRLGVLSGEAGLPRRALIPFKNQLLLCATLRIDKGVSVLILLFLLVLPISIIVIFPYLAGRLAVLTGRKRWIGWLVTLPPITVFGFVALALSSRRFAGKGQAIMTR